MCLVELEKHDEATAKIHAMRVFIQARDKENIPERLIAIYSLLMRITHTGYDFKAAYLKEKNTVDLLAQPNGPSAWFMKSAEMVIFHQWFIAKAFRQKFVQRIPKWRSKVVSTKASVE